MTTAASTEQITNKRPRRPISRVTLDFLGRNIGFIRAMLSLAAGLALWEFWGRVMMTNRLFFVPFSEAMQRLWELTESGDIWEHFKVSSQELLIGYAGAIMVGVIIGTLMGLNRTLRDVLGFWVDVFNATPVIAFAPIFILIWGLGLQSKVALILFISVWPIILNTQAGFMSAEAQLLEVVRSFGANPLQVFRMVRIPYALPYVMVGLRIAVGRAVVGVVVGELFGARAGLGYLLFESRERFDTAAIFASIIVLGVLAVTAVSIIALLERKVAPWRKAVGGGR